jgi:hypothetical protein
MWAQASRVILCLTAPAVGVSRKTDVLPESVHQITLFNKDNKVCSICLQ